MITILDYGLGNVRAFQNVYHRLSIPVSIASTSEELKKATRIIMPGVGAFDGAMKRLDGSGLRPALEECVLGRHVPFLGVCVGMQMLASTSEEGHLPGLGWVSGRVRRFSEASHGRGLRVPHMGWNDIKAARNDGLLAELGQDARFYFLHSYYFETDSQDAMIASANYGADFTCAIRSGNVYGVQFHPEKSHRWGMRLLENFARTVPA
ncbi:MAG: imidazole glycerol phosphate synthase subunit HisH [Deltaproteobacteria bacterium]|nr:imidazole glycerol phosphate synthase subunit HisH [Deltaproteobacteria bacterium]